MSIGTVTVNANVENTLQQPGMTHVSAQVSYTNPSVYVLPTGMMQRFPAGLVEKLDRSGLVNAAILSALIAGDSIVTEAQDLQDAAAASLIILQRTCDDSNSRIARSLNQAGYDIANLAALPNGLSAELSAYGCDLARFQLYDNGTLSQDEVVMIRFKSADQFFDDLAAGKITGLQGESESNLSTEFVNDSCQVFGSTGLSGYL